MRFFRFHGATLALGVILALIIATPTLQQAANGQAVSTNGGSIQGTVQDATGAAIPGAKVTISDPDTGFSRTLIANSTGFYSIGPLIPGNYTITVTVPGFEHEVVKTVVQTGTVTSGNVKLSVGNETQTVEVSAGEVQVNVDQIGVSGVISEKQIDDLPVNGRNVLDVAQLQPGVILESGMTFDPTKAGYSALSVSGIGGRTTRILLDGQDITDETVGTTIFNVPSGAIGELQLNRSTQDVSGEVTSTGQMLATTRSGTNHFHGNAFYNFQDDRAGFAPVQDLSAPFQRNQTGGYIGGPIWKDKLLFYGGAERIQQHESDVAEGANPIFQSIETAYPYTPAPFHDTYSTLRLDYNGPYNTHMFVRGAYSVNSDFATFGYGPYQVYENRDNVPALVGGIDMANGRFTHSVRYGYEKFHNLLVDGTAALGSSIYNPSTGPDNQVTLTGSLNAGPNYLAPQATYQSDKQTRYDGTYTRGNHTLKFGGELNRILNGGFADFYGPSLYTVLNAVPSSEVPCNDVVGAAPCPSNPTEGYAAALYVIGNGNGFFSERPGFGLPGGGSFSWRVAAYVGDGWRVNSNLNITAGVRWSADTDRANQDLPTPLCSTVAPALQFSGCTGDTPLFDQYQTGLGVRTNQPWKNVGPQVGFVYSPGSHKTSIRGGAGIYYESDVFNNTGNARPEAVTANGPYFNYTVASAGGSSINLPGAGVVTTAPDGTPVSKILSESIAHAAPELNAIKSAYQAKVKNVDTANGSYIGTGGGLFANNMYAGPYASPYSFQFNGGLQHEFSRGIFLSADYVRNTTVKVPISVDVNHVGAARTLNTAAAANAIASTLAECNVKSIDAAIKQCSPKGATPFAATIATFAGNGLDSAGALFSGYPAAAYGATVATGAAFPGTNPNVGEGLFILPEGRSEYDALQMVFQEQKAHPLQGFVSANIQVSYSLSRVTSTTSGNSADQFFAGARPWDNDAPNKYMGRSPIDHTQELSFGGSTEIKYGLHVGMIGHFFSAPPTSLLLDNTSGATGQIFQTDVNGDGLGGVSGSYLLFPGSKPGAYMHSIKGAWLNQAISKYNSTNAGQLTPAGQALVNAGLMTSAQLTGLNGVQQQIALQPDNSPMPNPAFRTFDLNATYPIKLKRLREGMSVVPGVAMYNAFNMENRGVQSGILLNNADAGPLGYVNSSNSLTEANNLRTTRNSGTYDQGGPRTTEFQLTVNF